MKITSSQIDFSAQYNRSESKRYTQQFGAQVREQGNNAGAQTSFVAGTDSRVSLNSTRSMNVYSRSSVQSASNEKKLEFEKQQMVQSVLSRFYTQKVRVTDMATIGSRDLPRQSQSSIPGTSTTGSMQFSEHYQYQDSQSLTFMAKGSITTDDGKNINFSFYVSGSQDFNYESGSGAFAEQIARRTDPLVINYGGGFNNLSDTAFKFDLDGDGTKEDLSFAGEGSGFLVLDRNKDGRINDGTEMFGTKTGNGFAELAKYDEDGNGFIDEGDSVYKELKIYTKDANGKDKLQSLDDLNIGAIGVESGVSPFAITDDHHNELGMARSTGIFITNDGEVGSVQQIDLTQRDLEHEQATKDAFARPSDPENSGAVMSDPDDIQSFIAKLDQATQDLFDRQDELSEQDDEDGPKDLLTQLVDKLEEYRTSINAAAEKQKEEAEKDA